MFNTIDSGVFRLSRDRSTSHTTYTTRSLSYMFSHEPSLVNRSEGLPIPEGKAQV